jgi:hypothetical protein
MASIRVMESLGYCADALVTSAPGLDPVMLYQPSP